MFGAKMMDFSFGYEHGIDTSYNMPMSNQEVRTRVRIYPYDLPLCPEFLIHFRVFLFKII